MHTNTSDFFQFLKTNAHFVFYIMVSIVLINQMFKKVLRALLKVTSNLSKAHETRESIAVK